MKGLYTLGIYAYVGAIRVASTFNSKARLWTSGRKGIVKQLSESPHRGQWIWFHAASLGEFEQGRPMIEMIREQYPDHPILLTFFSPSGFEVRKNYAQADHVTYMLADTPRNAREFVEAVSPKLAVFIKYELWFHHLNEMQKRHIHVLLISAQFRSDQFYFKPTGRFFLPVLRRINQIFTSDKSSHDVLMDNNFSNSQVAGDTRIDRVVSIANEHRDFSWIQDFLEGPIIVAGSTWPKDEQLLAERIRRGTESWVVAPHVISEERLASIEQMLGVDSVRLSKAKHASTRAKVIIVDTMGDLAHIYHVGQVAYVGGGFDTGIHNTLEPAAYGVPVLFGPNYQRFGEAVELIAIGAGHSVSNRADFSDRLDRSLTEDKQIAVRTSLDQFFRQHVGATGRIYNYIRNENLLE